MRPVFAHPNQQPNRGPKPEALKWLTKEEVAALLWGAKKTEPDSFPAFRCFSLMYLLGLRVGEARLLRYEHLPPRFIDDNGAPRAVDVPTLKKNPRKRGSTRPKPPPPKRWVPVLAHWSWVKDAFDPRNRTGKRAASGWLFPSPQTIDNPITERAIQYAWNRARAAAGLPICYTSHSLRHAAAKALFAKHREQIIVSRFLRHTTDIFGGTGSSATPTYLHMEVRDWEPMIKSKCLVLPELKPMPAGTRPHL